MTISSVRGDCWILIDRATRLQIPQCETEGSKSICATGNGDTSGNNVKASNYSFLALSQTASVLWAFYPMARRSIPPAARGPYDSGTLNLVVQSACCPIPRKSTALQLLRMVVGWPQQLQRGLRRIPFVFGT